MIIVYLTLATLVGYVAVDYGIYRSMKITISGQEGTPDGEYKLKDMISFVQYMKMALGSSAVKTRYGEEIEYGSVGTTISYVADLVGVGLGSMLILFIFSEKYPYCVPCGKYKKRLQQYVIQFVHTEELLKQIFSRFQELSQQQDT